MNIEQFSLQELEVVSVNAPTPLLPETVNYTYPISPKDAVIAAFEKKAVWQTIGAETRIFTPRLLPDNIARGFVLESKPFDPVNEGGGKDMFGIDWEYVQVAEGSMVKPGAPLLADANEWTDKLVWPDIDTWPWEDSAKANNGTYLKPDLYNVVPIMTGWYERLISFMDFEGAAIAMIDDEQQAAVKELFDKLSDLYIKIIDKFLLYFPDINGFQFHDDWGSQADTFFSPACVSELIVPAMQKVTAHLHAKGLYGDLHSCGQLMKQVPNIIAAGWDSWNPQLHNDIEQIYALYGDKLLLGAPCSYDADASKDEQRDCARAYANRYCLPRKPTTFNTYSAHLLTPAFWEELYIQSRKCYGAKNVKLKTLGRNIGEILVADKFLDL
ncbi:MAG: hypothetical protein LBG97_08495 [Coriobacteriales bacterium]|jgi:hypothetical protein|nr:hypothetical protein [Coriobacteriales bacterium]